MGIWHILFIVVGIALTLLYVYLWKWYPVLSMPFDNEYRSFRRAYRAYRPVRKGRMSYNVFADDHLIGFKGSYEAKAGSEEARIANRLSHIIKNHREMVERYFAVKFGYSDYLNLKSEYDLIERQTRQKRTEPLQGKLLFFETLFSICHVQESVSRSNKARVICDLLERELNYEKIGDTNLYKKMTEYTKEPRTRDEYISRIEAKRYVADQLECLGLKKERDLILGDISDLQSNIVD